VVYRAPMRSSTWHRRRLTALLASGILVVGLGACSDDGGDDDGNGDSDSGNVDDGDDGDEGDDDGASGASAITISGFEFDGATVEAGATVAVSNEDTTPHTVTGDDGDFEVSVSGGEEGEITAPSEPGSYAYHCAIHSSMTGTLVVE
jgi:plastocyanin